MYFILFFALIHLISSFVFCKLNDELLALKFFKWLTEISAKFYRNLISAIKKRSLIGEKEPAILDSSEEKKRKSELEKIRKHFDINKTIACIWDGNVSLKRSSELNGFFFLFSTCFVFSAKGLSKKKVKQTFFVNVHIFSKSFKFHGTQ